MNIEETQEESKVVEIDEQKTSKVEEEDNEPAQESNKKDD